ncbi:melatonin receptor type 1C-like [Amphiura filiformis]|uniref:melatonin receptor type 1C-like n=1 Tax=Amphiura filiformis TaxID=82378 RepID=UPI003B21001C
MYNSTVIESLIDHKAAGAVFVITIIMTITGTIGNFLVIGSVMIHKKLRVLSNTFIVNLAIADLMVSIAVNASGLMATTTNGRFLYTRPGLCEFFGSVCITACLSSVMNIAAISINRYVKICHFKYYDKIYNRRTVPGMVIFVWIFCFCLDLPNFFRWGSHDFSPKFMLCSYDHRYGAFSYTLFFFLGGFCLPWNISGLAYLKIFLFTRESNKKLRESMSNSAGGNSKPVGINELRILRSTVTIWAVFLIMWIPYAFAILLDTGYHWPNGVYSFASMMAHFNSSINCILYAITSKHFREAYWSLLTCRWLVVGAKVGAENSSIQQSKSMDTNSTTAGTRDLQANA